MADALGAVLEALNLDGPPFSCALCGVHAIHSLQQLEEHRAGKRHRRRLAGGGGGKRTRCNLCNVTCATRAELREHFETEEHAAKMQEFAARAEEALQDLDKLNTWLFRLGRQAEETAAKARASLKRVNVNIYDLVNDRLEPVFATVAELRNYTKKNNKIFPLQSAKADGLLRLFLRPLFA
jgi:hypothetical protein